MKRFLFYCVKVAALGAIIFVCVPSVGFSMAPSEDPAEVLIILEEQFDMGDWEEAQLTAENYLKRHDLSEDQRFAAQVLLARSYLGLGNIDMAQTSFCEALRLDPQWRPNEIIFSQDEIVSFNEAQSSCDPEPIGAQEDLVAEMEVDPQPTVSPKTAKSAVLRSIVPGMGQHYKGQKTKGFVFQAACAGALAFALVSDSAMNSAADDYNATRDAYLAADTQEEMDALFSQMEEQYQEVDDKQSQRDTALLALGGIWVINLIDAGLGFPLEESGVQVGHVVTPSGQPAVAVMLWR